MLCLLFVVQVVFGKRDSDVLRVIRSLIASSYLDREYTADSWHLETATTVQNDALYQQYMYVFVKHFENT